MRIETKPKQYELFSGIPLRAGTDKLNEIQKSGAIVLGASGHMGTNIVDALTRADIYTLRNDINHGVLEKSLDKTKATQEKAASLRKLALPQLERAKNNLGPPVVFPEGNKIPSLDNATDKNLEAASFINTSVQDPLTANRFKEAKLFVEAGPENLAFKQNVFGFFAYALDNGAILATNTSTLRVSEIASKVPNPERVVGLHFFDPADRNPLLEIIVSPQTSPETVVAMREIAISMGKTPIICWGDPEGAFANRILIGVLNEASHMAFEGADPDVVDKVFLETFYRDQIRVQLKSAKKQLQGAPKLGLFKDETYLYKKIKALDIEIQRLEKKLSTQLAQDLLLMVELKERLEEKQKLLEEAVDKLNQKVVYATVLQNLASLGTFFVPPPIVQVLKERAQNQLKEVRKSLVNIKAPFEVKPYEDPRQEGKTKQFTEEKIRDRLIGAYIAISQQVYIDGLASCQDIELACKQGFYWNIGPLEIAQELGPQEAARLTKLVHNRLTNSGTTGISKPGVVVELNDNELSGVQTYIQDRIGHIVMGRRHIQNLRQEHNSLSPEMLKAIAKAVKSFEQNPNVKSIFLESQGGGPFSAGADLNYVNNKINWDKDKTGEYLTLGYQVIMNTIRNCRKTTVAIIDGLALGGGAELASACDYRIGTHYSGISFPEVNLVHIYPGWGGDKTFPAIVGEKLALAIMVPPVKKGVVILGAEDAHQVGYLDRLVLQSDLPHRKADLIEGKVPGIDIYKKPPPKNNYDKNDYSEKIIKKYHLDKLDHPRRRIFGAYSANLTRDLIKHSRDPNYRPNEEELRKVLKAGWFNARFFIGFQLWFAQSWLAKLLRK